MGDTFSFIKIPTTNPAALITAGIICIFLFVGAVIFEVVRKRRAQRERLQQLWASISEIVNEKGIDQDQWALLREIAQRFSAEDPLRFVTVRRHFNQCITDYMESLRGTVDEDRYAEAGAVLRDARIRLGLDYIPFGRRIESTRELAPGQSLWARTAGDRPGDWIQMTVTGVDEAYLHAIPRRDKQGNYPRLKIGAQLRCRMWREEDARYLFTTSVARVDGEPPRITLFNAGCEKRMQSRQYYRVRHSQPVTAGIVSYPSDGDFTNVRERPVTTRIRGRITSLSAGGLAIEMPQALPNQVLIRLSLALDEATPVTVDSRIVGVSSLPAGMHLVRVSYVDIDEETRDTIAQYVWRRQQPLLGHDDEST